MKKTILFILLLFSTSSVGAYSLPENFDKGCFEKESIILDVNRGTIKVESDERYFFPIQDGELLNYRLFNNSTTKNISYDIVDISSGNTSHTKFIKDGNRNTSFEFDVMKNKEKTIIIKFFEKIEAYKFQSNFYFYNYDKAEFWISDDNINYTKVREKDLNYYSFVYLKVKFIDNYESRKTKIYDINFTEKEKSVYVLNSNSDNEISFYAANRCNEDQLTNEFIVNYEKDNNNASYGININTEEYKLDWKSNDLYKKDLDSDGVLNNADNCPFKFNADQLDSDNDLVGDVCDWNNEEQNYYEQDIDGDGVGDSIDNCKYIYNPEQKDKNANGVGNECSDDDRDGVIGKLDNCPGLFNPNQEDRNINGLGDACEFDKDDDGLFDSIDNCVTEPNSDQKDSDGDGIGDICDNCKFSNPDQIDKNQNGIGDTCEKEKEYVEENDKDEDGILDYKDNCEDVSNKDQKDSDKDGIGDLCDNCPNFKNSKQEDKNENGVGDWCEDVDGDGLVGLEDNCIWHANNDQKDDDNNGVGNICEDKDGDNIVAIEDNCPFEYNTYQSDVDKDGIGDSCDEEDNRYIESNKNAFIIFMVMIVVMFGIGIGVMVRKLQ